MSKYILFILSTVLFSLSFDARSMELMAQSKRSCLDVINRDGVGANRKTQKNNGISWQHVNQRGRVAKPTFTGTFTSQGPTTNGMKMAFDLFLAAGKKYSFLFYGGTVRSYDPERPTALLLHGVADRRQDLDPFTKELIDRGWQVVVPDLLYHGETGELNPDLARVTVEHEYEILGELLKSLRVKNIVIIGHSRGGGLAIGASDYFKKIDIKTLARVPVAPYLSEIDKFFMERIFTPEVIQFLRDAYPTPTLLDVTKIFSEAINSFFTASLAQYGLGLPSNTLATAAENICAFGVSVYKALSDLNIEISHRTYTESFRQFLNTISEPALRALLKNLFTKYLTQKNEKLPNELQQSLAEIEKRVDGAVESTILMQGVDHQRRDRDIPGGDVPTLIITGEKDKISTPPQMNDFMGLAENQKADIKHISLESGDHHLIQKQSESVAKEMMDWLHARGIFKSRDFN